MLTTSMGQGTQAMKYQKNAFTEEDMYEMNKKFKMVTHCRSHMYVQNRKQWLQKKILLL